MPSRRWVALPFRVSLCLSFHWLDFLAGIVCCAWKVRAGCGRLNRAGWRWDMVACWIIRLPRWIARLRRWSANWNSRKGRIMSRRAGLDKETVIQAAAELVDEQGIEQLSLARLAERLHVRSPSLYNHVPSGIEGLRRDLALMGARELYPRLSRATIGKARDEAV